MFPPRTSRFPGLIDDALAAWATAIAPNPLADAPETKAAEASLYEFSKQAWPYIRPGDRFVDGWVFGCLAEHVQAVLDGQIKKLGIAVPPRHSKSLLVCVFGPTWKWTNRPSYRSIYSSYSAKLANRDSMACRELIQTAWYQARWGHKFRFKYDQNRQDQFSNDRGGFRIATTPGGMATGEGAELLVADDATSVEDSFSPAAMEAAWRYWTQTMTMRFQNPDDLARLVSMQRTRKTDILGRLIAENFGYEILTLPFEAEPNRIYFLPAQRSELGLPPLPPDVGKPKHAIVPTSLQIARPHLRDGRELGGMLWPERFGNPETVKDLKKGVQAGAGGQLQQRPEDDAGSVFKVTKFKLCYPVHTDDGLGFLMSTDEKARLVYASECVWYQTADTAMKAEEANDFTAFATVAKSPAGDLIVYDMSQFRLLIPEQWPAFKQFRDGRPEWSDARREWSLPGKARPWPKPLMFQSVESKNSGISLMQLARSEGRPLKELVADTNKVMRAATIAQLYESGCVYHNAEGAWRTEVEEQLSNFPTGTHDDCADCLAYAGILFVHDNLLAAYTGDMVYNDRVHQEIALVNDAHKSGAEGQWIPPHLRPAPSSAPENIDEILAALQGRPTPRPPAVTDDGRIRDEFLYDED